MNWLFVKRLRAFVVLAALSSLVLNVALLMPAIYMMQVFDRVFASGSVETLVMLGAVTWPLMRRAGYPADTAGAVLAAAGIGAILAPPVMGAAAFLIAEFLNVSYLEVIVMAAIPAALYYLSIFLMVEADSHRLGLRPINADLPGLGALTRRGWYHFASMASIVVLMVQVGKRGLVPANQRRLMCLSLFWHFLDVIWIGVFTFVYLIGSLR